MTTSDAIVRDLVAFAVTTLLLVWRCAGRSAAVDAEAQLDRSNVNENYLPGPRIPVAQGYLERTSGPIFFLFHSGFELGIITLTLT